MITEEKEPLISVIVPVFNTEIYLRRCINSLMRQSYKNIEIIIVNDASPGNVNEIIQEYSHDVRVKYYTNETNQGLLRTRVIGASKATGDYIAFVDSDDYVSLDFYRVLLAKALETDADITIGKTVWDEAGERYVFNYHDSCFQFDILMGNNVQKSFFEQETFCYSWHTIWNKLYTKQLWDVSMNEFTKVDSHIIMTEDIYFSSILFWYAHKVTKVENEAYFYCINDNASTNSKQISFDRFKKNVNDIKFVFDTVQQFLNKVNADKEILIGFGKGKQHYSRMWSNLARHSFKDQELKWANEILADFCVCSDLTNVQDEYFFESVKTPWNGGLEFIKEQILKSPVEFISFDVFDTLITRPFYDPKDLLLLLNKRFMDITNSNVLFSKIRIDGEILARNHYGMSLSYGDITIDEIYNFISMHYGLNLECMQKMLEYEKQLELLFCKARKAGKELYEFAYAVGKKLVLVTDMYLDLDTIGQILRTNGYKLHKKVYVSSQERCLKYDGKLFEVVLNDLDIDANNIIHIGDTWKNDIEGSKKAGIESIFFPKAIEVFENKINGCTTNRCADIGKTIAGKNVSYEKIEENIGFRSMIAMVAHKYFDNPYRVFNAKSDFNIDPYFIGYYLVGMHMLGISKWISNTCNNQDYSNILFLARDGYLPKKIYDKYLKAYSLPYNTMYVQTSRRAVMPLILKEAINLYQMPIEYRAHSPKTVMRILEFMSKGSSKDLKNLITNFDKPFETLEEYHDFISMFLIEYYDSQKHSEAKKMVSQYFERIPDKSITFDMGYSGRIQAAICEATGKSINALFIHEDYSMATHLKNYKQFEVYPFYQYRPEITGLLREHIFSDTNGSCIGYESSDGCVLPIIENKRHDYPDQYVIQSIHNGAIVFAEEFLTTFSKFMNEIDYSPEEVSYPFEGFLMNPCEMDMHIFSASYFEDMVFGGNCSINIEQFAKQVLNNKGVILRTNLLEIPVTSITDNEESTDLGMEDTEAKDIMDIINRSSQYRRAIAWVVLDLPFFINKLKINVKRKMGLEEK